MRRMPYQRRRSVVNPTEVYHCAIQQGPESARPGPGGLLGGRDHPLFKSCTYARGTMWDASQKDRGRKTKAGLEDLPHSGAYKKVLNGEINSRKDLQCWFSMNFRYLPTTVAFDEALKALGVDPETAMADVIVPIPAGRCGTRP